LDWGKKIGTIIAGFYAFYAAVKLVNIALALMAAISAANPVSLLIIGIATASILLYAFRNEIELFLFKVFDYFAEVGNAIAFLFTPVIKFFEIAIGSWIAIFDFFSDVWNNGWEAIKIRLIGVLDFVLGYYKGILDGFIKGVFAFSGYVLSAFSFMSEMLVNIWAMDFEGLKNQFIGLWESIKQLSLDAVNWLLDKLGPLGKFLDKFLNIGAAITGSVDVVQNVSELTTQASTRAADITNMRAAELPTWVQVQIDRAALSGSSQMPDIYNSIFAESQTDNRRPSQMAFQPSVKPIAPKPKIVIDNSGIEQYLRQPSGGAEITIRDESKRAQVTRGKLPAGVNLVHSGGM
jgi:hypothetical protein